MNRFRKTLCAFAITAMPAALALGAAPALAKGGRVSQAPVASSTKSTSTTTSTTTSSSTRTSSSNSRSPRVRSNAKPTPTPTPTVVANGTLLGGCSTTLTTPDAAACAGYYAGNILDGSSTDIAIQQQAIADLPGSFTWDGDWNALVNAGDVITTLTNGNELDFGQTLFGQVILGVHYGNVPDPNAAQGNVTVFWLFNLTTPTNFISLDSTQGWSNAVLYRTDPPPPPETPEPGTWAMMLVGFGAVGVAVRRSRRSKPLAAQV